MYQCDRIGCGPPAAHHTAAECPPTIRRESACPTSHSAVLARVHLSRLDLTNFRSCSDTAVCFQPGLTVLVGENNSGKSNIIDALRLVTLPTDGRRTRYCEMNDFTFGAEHSGIDIRATYSDLSLEESAMFISAMTGPEASEIAYRMRYSAPGPSERRGRYAWTVGNNDGPEADSGGRDRLRHVYLPPLRDAEAALASGSGERIDFVIRTLAQENEIDELESASAAAFEDLEGEALLARAQGLVGGRLDQLSRGAIQQTAALGFVTPTLRALARALRFRLGAAGIEPAELSHSGLGYANLLFLATVLVELDALKDSDLTLFLVEEPEAHLHPQLQSAVLALLAELGSSSERPGPSVQVIVSTHSAQLAASVSATNVAVVKPAQSASSDADAHSATTVVPVWKLGLPSEAVAKVNRYINATRSPILFGPRVLLVEGLAEAILLPVLAKRQLSDESDLARFRTVALCPIDGVDFEPYVRLLLTPCDGSSIAERVVVITDLDPRVPGDRRNALQTLARELGAASRLSVSVASVTLEADLYAAGNADVLHSAFLEQRPDSQHRLDELADVDEGGRATAFADLVAMSRVSKGQLAQSVAALIEAGEEIRVPSYLTQAIADVVAR